MKKVNLNVCLLDLDGKEIETGNMGKLLGSAMAASNKGDALKNWSIAQRLYSGEEVELDPADLKMVEEFVKANDGFTNLAKAQILSRLSNE